MQMRNREGHEGTRRRWSGEAAGTAGPRTTDHGATDELGTRNAVSTITITIRSTG